MLPAALLAATLAAGQEPKQMAVTLDDLPFWL